MQSHLFHVHKHPEEEEEVGVWGWHAPVTLPHKADSRGEDPPAAHRLQQEAVSCSRRPCCTVPRLSGVKCACDIARREQRELNSGNYNQVRA